MCLTQVYNKQIQRNTYETDFKFKFQFGQISIKHKKHIKACLLKNDVRIVSYRAAQVARYARTPVFTTPVPVCARTSGLSTFLMSVKIYNCKNIQQKFNAFAANLAPTLDSS